MENLLEIIARAIKEIEKLEEENKDKTHVVTADIRRISNQLFHCLDNTSIDYVLNLCEILLEQQSWSLGVMAYDWAYRVRKQYREDTFQIFEQWLIKYVRGWGDCDDFCTHAFGELICQYPQLFPRVIEWTTREEFWMRRAAAVILIPSINKGKYREIKPFLIADFLMMDSEPLVCKGYGWMLKNLSLKEEEEVYQYLWNNRDKMPRVAFRYALEKMDSEKKARLMGR